MKGGPRMRVRLSAPVLTLLIGVAATTAAQSGRFDYPQWRGLHRDGGASGFVEPSAWPAALTRQWTLAVGEGYATPNRPSRATGSSSRT